MKRATLVVGFCMVSFVSSSQGNPVVDSIRNEGRLLYRLEMASWHATDIFLRNYRDKAKDIGGYFSYQSNQTVYSVFFSGEADPKIIATFSFDTSLNAVKAIKDVRSRKFTRHEQRLFNIQSQAMLATRSDTSFSFYENTRFNFIPIADSNSGKVYILTQPEVQGVVIFGNDYLLQFNKADSLLNKKALHSTIIPVDFGKDTDPELIETFHVHTKEAGKFITPTDICTLMLYQRFAKWKTHLVMSKTHVCAWDIETGELNVFSSEEWNKQNNNKKQVGVTY